MAVAAPDEEDTFHRLKRWTADGLGLESTPYKENYLKRRVAARMRARGIATYGDYVDLLDADPRERQRLQKDLTVNVTRFFRDPDVFRVLAEDTLPLLIYEKVRRRRRVLRFWSAGCATGEEAFTLGMILLDLLGDERPRFIASILGTDVDRASLEVAQNGVYTAKQVESVPEEYRDAYLAPRGASYQVVPALRRVVRFRAMDLFADPLETHFDAVLCRNVAIYLSEPMQHRLLGNLRDALNEGGYLVLGKTETPVGPALSSFQEVHGGARIYQKVASWPR